MYLKETMGRWLGSFIICVILDIIFFRKGASSIWNTISVMLMYTLIVLLFELLLVMLGCIKRRLGFLNFLLMLTITIIAGVNGFISRWYIIVPMFTLLLLYMCWFMGGIINCIDCEGHNFHEINDYAKKAYEDYSELRKSVDNYNNKNSYGFFRKIRIQSYVWNKYRFDSSMLFQVDVALFGINIYYYDKLLDEIKDIADEIGGQLISLETNNDNVNEGKLLKDIIDINRQSDEGNLPEGMEEELAEAVRENKIITKQNKKETRRLFKTIRRKRRMSGYGW